MILNTFLVIDASHMLIGLPLLIILKGKKLISEYLLNYKLIKCKDIICFMNFLSNDSKMKNLVVLFVIFLIRNIHLETSKSLK